MVLLKRPLVAQAVAQKVRYTQCYGETLPLRLRRADQLDLGAGASSAAQIMRRLPIAHRTAAVMRWKANPMASNAKTFSNQGAYYVGALLEAAHYIPRRDAANTNSMAGRTQEPRLTFHQ